MARFKLVVYDDFLLFDQVEGISVKPLGFLSTVFAVVGKPDLKQTRLATSPDQWQVMQGRVKVLPGVWKTGTAVIEPGGRGHAMCQQGAATSQPWSSDSTDRWRFDTASRPVDCASAPAPEARLLFVENDWGHQLGVTMNVAFLGLGSMGSAMAENLLRAGHTLTVYNRTRSAAEPLGRAGARVATTPREAAGKAEVLITMLSDDAAVEAVLFGDNGALESLPVARSTPR